MSQKLTKDDKEDLKMLAVSAPSVNLQSSAILKLLSHIEALEEENERLKKDCDELQTRWGRSYSV